MSSNDSPLQRGSARPAKLFASAAAGSLIISVIYFWFFPDSYFDLSVGPYLTVNSVMLWIIFTAYLLFLSLIYFVAARGRLPMRRWLVSAHYVFVLLFLIIFLVFSQFNEHYLQRLLSTYSATAIFFAYAVLFFADLGLFLVGLILLAANIAQFSKQRNRKS